MPHDPSTQVVWIPFTEDPHDREVHNQLGAFTTKDEAVKAGPIAQLLYEERTGATSEMYYSTVPVFESVDE